MSVTEVPSLGFTSAELMQPSEDTLRRIYDGGPFEPPDINLWVTAGPRTDDPRVLEQLLDYSQHFRVNGGQNTHEEAATRIKQIRTVAADKGVDVSILVDPPGPKDRVDESMVGYREVKPGTSVRFQHKPLIAQGDTYPVPLAGDLSQVVEPGHPLLMFDGALSFVIAGVNREESWFEAVSKGSGRFGRRQGLNLPNARFETGYLEEDKEWMQFLASQAVDYSVISFAQSGDDIKGARADARSFGNTSKIGGKIEDRGGMENATGIVEASDLIVVAQGDMGPMVGKQRILRSMLRLGATANNFETEWVVATGMMESVKDGRTATPSDLGYVGAVAMAGGHVWLSAEIAMNQDNVSVARQARQQITEYAGQAMMLFMALPKQFRQALVTSIINGSDNGNGHF